MGYEVAIPRRDNNLISADQSTDIKVLVNQVLKQVKAGTGVNLDLDNKPVSIQIDTINIYSAPPKEEVPEAPIVSLEIPDSLRDRQDIWKLIEELPPPRLENLRLLAITLAFSHFELQKDAAAFLGVTPETASRWPKEIKRIPNNVRRLK